MNIIPKIGSRGCYEISAPFDTIIDPNKLYTCTAIRSIKEMVYSQDRPFETIYEPNGLTENNYNTDIANSVFIITLTGDAGENIYVPNTYINSYPYINGIVYQSKSMVINLGPLPKDEDLSTLISRIKDEVQNTIGIVTDPKLVTTSGDFKVSYTDDVNLRAARDGYKTTYKSYKTQYDESLSLISELGTQVGLLECTLSNNCCGKDCSGADGVSETESEHIEVCETNNLLSDVLTTKMLYAQSDCFTKTHRNDKPKGGHAPYYVRPAYVNDYEFDVGMYIYSPSSDISYRNNV